MNAMANDRSSKRGENELRIHELEAELERLRAAAQTANRAVDAQFIVWRDRVEKAEAELRAVAQTPDYLEDLAQWADAAVELFPVHGERFQEIARVLRAGAAQALPRRDAIARVIFPNAFLDENEKSPPVRLWSQAMQDAAFETADAVLALFQAPAQAALNPGMREALERIRDFPIGGHAAAGAMALIARQALDPPPHNESYHGKQKRTRKI
jgi:hypothetical protein